MEKHDINATEVIDGGTSPDTGIWYNNNATPVANLYNDNKDYFIYHHTDGKSCLIYINAEES